MQEILKKLGDVGLVPVIKLNSSRQAIALGKSLLAASLPIAEITLRTEAAIASIRELSGAFPDMAIGAGTVLTIEQVQEAAAAGARYIVTPGFNPKVVSYCTENDIPIIPGVSSPSQVEQALEYNLKIVKFFPAEAAGGLNMLKSLLEPYGSRISFIPTGGISPLNASAYLSCPNVFAVGGSWMTPTEAIDKGDFATVERLCRRARIQSLGFELLHVGINPGEEVKPAAEHAAFLSAILGMPMSEKSDSIFVGRSFALMKTGGTGKHGHLAIETLSVERALRWFSAFGIEAVRESIRRDDRHNIIAAYLDHPFMGFALHINRKQHVGERNPSYGEK